jgi:pyruvate dehydrogenase E1 component beta subunit
MENHSKESKKTFLEAIREGIAEEMRRDETVFVMGEDVAFGIFGVTRGLYEEFGEERVRDTPISESAIVGLAVGAALMGMRPIAEIMFADFIPLAFDQITNSASKMRYVHGGRASVPLVVRIPQGAGRHSGPWHSQSLEAMLLNIPGIKVVMPSTPFDAKGLIKTSIRDNDPVVYLEHKLLYGISGFVPEEEYLIPFGKADIKREGSDVTLIATQITVHKALLAAEKLQKEGISVEVVDPRTLVPLDKHTIVESAKKTGRVVIVHEACKTGGVGAELMAVVVEGAFNYLDAPIKRLGAPFTPVPFSPPLEDFWLSFSSENAIIKAVKEIIRAG